MLDEQENGAVAALLEALAGRMGEDPLGADVRRVATVLRTRRDGVRGSGPGVPQRGRVRNRTAEQRDQAADQRDQAADQRDQAADQRDQAADQR
ncbi:hypothetical protein, partial [Planobispora takensis]